MTVEVLLVNSFTSNGSGGNPAGVVLKADNLSWAQKQQIAQKVGYSETAFVSSDDEADFEITFFTVTGEVDFCGHATLAAFSVLYKMSIIEPGKYIQRTKAGLLPVVIDPDGHVVMELQLPKKLGGFSYEEISEVIGIEHSILEKTKLPIEIVSTGMVDVIIPIPKGYLDLIEANDSLISDFCREHDVLGFHLFELGDPDEPHTASCRNFAPLVGIHEESATGSSSGALACYLAEHLDSKNTSFTFEQGRAMNCQSIITASVELNDLKIVKVKVGGVAKQMGKMQITL